MLRALRTRIRFPGSVSQPVSSWRSLTSTPTAGADTHANAVVGGTGPVGLRSSYHSYSAAPTEAPWSVAFDIDGVLVRGRESLPRSRQVLEFLETQRIPYVFLTNCGRFSEERKAKWLSDIVGFPVDPRRMIVAHSPLRNAMPEAEKRQHRILLCGDGDTASVARQYGYTNLVTSADLIRQVPDLCHDCSVQERLPFDPTPISSIFLMCDTLHWFRDLQLCTDVLLSDGNPFNRRLTEQCPQTVSVHVTNNDLVYAGAFKYPRFGYGAFAVCLKTLYKQLHPLQADLQCTNYGKPYKTSYRFAEALLDRIAADLGYSSAGPIYAIGDNPYVDVAGANSAGNRWASVLARTGCWHDADADNHHEHPANMVAHDAWDAVHVLSEYYGTR